MPLAKILYSGFYDTPLAFVTSQENTQYVFWRGFFDEQIDDYPTHYQVFVLPIFQKNKSTNPHVITGEGYSLRRQSVYESSSI